MIDRDLHLKPVHFYQLAPFPRKVRDSHASLLVVIGHHVKPRRNQAKADKLDSLASD
jgi:hypothetical protein